MIVAKKGIEESGVGRYCEALASVIGQEPCYISSIEQLAYFSRDSVIVLAGFDYKDIWMAKNYTDRLYYVFASPLGQALFSPNQSELFLLKKCLEFKQNGTLTDIICLSEDLAQIYDLKCIHGFLCDKDIAVLRTLFEDKIENKISGAGISYLGRNNRPHKNTLNNLMACDLLSKKYREEILVNDNYGFYLDFFDFNIKNIGRLGRLDLWAEMSKHRMFIQCSYSESFNYMAFEYILLGVPILVSPCFKWAASKFICNNIDSPIAMKNRIENDCYGFNIKDVDHYYGSNAARKSNATAEMESL